MSETDRNNLHAGHRLKLKKRFAEAGFQQFEDHQVLEFLLFFAIPRRDTNEIAHRLIERFGSLNAVLEARPDELKQVEGVGDHAALLLSSYLPVARRYGDGIARGTKPLPLYKDMGRMLIDHFAGLDYEEVYAIFYDLSLQRCGDVVLHRGDINSAGFSMRHLGEEVIRSKGSYMILAHNHPGGLPIASPDDLNTTDSIDRLITDLGVVLIDHFIVGNGSFSSLQKDIYIDLYRETRAHR